MSASSAEDHWRYPGWRVVLGSFLGVSVGFGSLLVFTFSVFLKPLGSEFGWSREAISRAFAIAALTLAVCSPKLGQWLDRYGPRRIVLPCIAIFGLAFASLALLTPSLLHLYAVFLLIGIVGNATSQMGYTRAVATWFRRRRGLAFAIVVAGSATGSIFLPPLAQSLIASYGWRAAYAFLGALVLVLAIPAASLLVRERPVAPDRAEQPESGSTVRQGLHSPVFWILVTVLVLNSVSVNGAITHLSALLTDRGLAARQSSLIASALGAASFLGRIVAGWLLDRFFAPRVSFFLLLAPAAGIALLAIAATLPTAACAAVLVGIGLGGEADITPYLLTRYFGLRSFSALYGFTWTAYAIAGAIGPIAMGRVYDLTGSYSRLLLILALASALSAALMLRLPHYNDSLKTIANVHGPEAVSEPRP